MERTFAPASGAGERCRNHGERRSEPFDGFQIGRVRPSIAHVVKEVVVSDDRDIPPAAAVDIFCFAARYRAARKASVDPEPGSGHRLGHHQFHLIVGSLQDIAGRQSGADIGTKMNPRLRSRHQSRSALELANWLERHPKVRRVHYPGLPSHPQHELARRQQSAGGAIISFEVDGGRAAAWSVVDACKVISITANLGDTKSTITHPASTTHGRVAPAARAAAGIDEGLLRVAVGLESIADLEADLGRGLGQ